MPNSIEYMGLKHYPQGNAVLQKNGQWLHVSGLDEVHDGVAIETNGAVAWDVSIEPVTINASTVLGATFVQRDYLKRIRTVAQWAIMHCPKGNHAYLVINNKLEGGQIHVNARKENREQSSKFIKNTVDPKSEWFVAATFDLRDMPLAVSNIEYSMQHICNNSGLITGVSITKSFCCNGIIIMDDRIQSSSFIKRKDSSFALDQLHITSGFAYPHGLSAGQSPSISRVIVTGQGMEQLSIFNEHYSKEDSQAA